jgi:Phosphotransferase enzyme family
MALTAPALEPSLGGLFEDSGAPGMEELRGLLSELFPGGESSYRFAGEQKLASSHGRAYRLRFENEREIRSLIVKKLEPAVAQRNELVARRWLPAIGIAKGGPALLGVAAARNGECVWHAYEDLGDWALDGSAPDRESITAAVELIARVHTGFAGNPLLAECRLYGANFGIGFFADSVRDAIRCLHALKPGQLQVRERLLERLYGLLAEQPKRARALRDCGGPETLLHGDLWTSNTFVIPAAERLEARLIDWDHAGAGPVSYDLSTFLLRFPREERPWILNAYRAAIARAGWELADGGDLNLLFDTAECARLANTLIWPAITAYQEGAQWALRLLTDIDRWFERMEPVLPLTERVWGLQP